MKFVDVDEKSIIAQRSDGRMDEDTPFDVAITNMYTQIDLYHCTT